jgi:hypothetical protein
MRWCVTFVLALGCASLADDPDPVLSGELETARDGERPVQGDRKCFDCPIMTIQKGEFSNYQFGDPGFLGLHAVIKDPMSWERFWREHSADNAGPPPVDFRYWRVLVAVQGMQSSACGPSITIHAVHRHGPTALVRIVDDETPGPCDAISNPFHIVRVSTRCLGTATSVGFISYGPGPLPGVVVGHVMGITEDGTILPVGGALVRLARPEDPDLVLERYTNDDGFYHFEELPPGPYHASAFAPGFAPVLGEPLEVPPGETVERDFVLEPAGPGQGMIIGQVRGGISWEESGPLPCAHVFLFAGPDPGQPAPVREALTDCEGVYRLFDVEPGQYHMLAEAAGFLPEEVDVVVPPGNEPVEQHFLLHPE